MSVKRSRTNENIFVHETPNVSKRRRARPIDFTQLQNLRQDHARSEENLQQTALTVKIKDAEAALKSAGFTTVFAFLEALHLCKDQQTSATLSRQLGHHGQALLQMLCSWQPQLTKSFAVDLTERTLSKEADALVELLRPGDHSNIMRTLATFSLDTILRDAQQVAPTLCCMLRAAGRRPGEDTRRNDDLVIATILGMLAQVRNEKSSQIQTTMCIYLLACGASRTQFDILNHAGFSLSYSSAIGKVKELGQAKLKQIVHIAHSQPFLIIWDNLNIAFRVGEQRKASKDHFDNGTTATLIPLFDVESGSIPIELNPPRTTRRPVIEEIKSEYLLPSAQQVRELEAEMIWHIEDILFEAYPAARSRLKSSIPPPTDIDAIPIHETEQYPLPAMHIDESSLDGTLQVIEQIVTKVLKMDEEAIKKHGIILCAGDQLSISLLDKAAASRRDDADLVDNIGRYTEGQLGLFHVKMAATRMVANEYWGTPNSKCPWSLWKVNSFLGRKAISAGWKAKSPTPFRPMYDLILSLTLPAHVLEAFRILCPEDALDNWVEKVADYNDIHRIAIMVHQEFCSARRVSTLRNLDERDVPFENIILFIRDALILRSLRHSIRRGDVGMVINILAYWMVMFRGTGKMPKYADALFHLLVRLKTMHPKLRNAFLRNWLANLSGRVNGFKEMDLLQEHQNFWAKVIYNARGSNRTWAWLAMISVSIFALRDVIRQVQRNYEIPHNSFLHASPDPHDDIEDLRDYLQKESLMAYTPDRAFNKLAIPARDLFSEGAAYANTASAFKNFKSDLRSATNRGLPTPLAATTEEEPEEEESFFDLNDNIELELDDLALDTEEFPSYMNPEDLVSAVQDTIMEFSMYD